MAAPKRGPLGETLPTREVVANDVCMVKRHRGKMTGIEELDRRSIRARAQSPTDPPESERDAYCMPPRVPPRIRVDADDAHGLHLKTGLLFELPPHGRFCRFPELDDPPGKRVHSRERRFPAQDRDEPVLEEENAVDHEPRIAHSDPSRIGIRIL